MTDSAEEPLREAIVDKIKTIFDPEIPVDIWELGLIYDLIVGDENHIKVVMTLTSPMCPVAESLPPEVEQKVRGVPGVNDVELELTWEPPWEPSMMSEAAKLGVVMAPSTVLFWSARYTSLPGMTVATAPRLVRVDSSRAEG